MPDNESPGHCPEYSRGLRSLRRRRRFLAGVILVYVPLIWASLKLTHSDRVTGLVFALWVVALFFAVLFLCLGKCPRCGNPFHLYGFIPLCLRRCLHCGLGIKADK
jgi:hypothetical protein